MPARGHKKLNSEQTSQIALLARMGASHKIIASELHIHRATVGKCLKRLAGEFVSSKKQLTVEEQFQRHVRDAEVWTRLDSLTRMSNKAIEGILGISQHERRKLFKAKGMSKRVVAKKPFLSDAHIAARLAWALHHRHWTVDQWRRVVWSDESSINLGKLAGKTYVLRSANTRYDHCNLMPAFKEHKKAIMVWGCFFGDTLGPLEYFAKGSIDSETYCETLRKSLLCLVDEEDGLIENLLGQRNLIFQQDNAPIHKSRKTKEFFEANGLTTLPWPANSPDLNPIEHVWHVLKRSIWKTWYHKSSNINATADTDGLKLRIMEAWKAIDASYLKELVDSMPRRIEAVIKAGGGHTKY